MPPLPKSSRRPSTGKTRERASSEPSSSSTPRPAGRSPRTTKLDVLREQVARMYMMVGVMLKPFGRFYPVLGPIGDNFQELSNEAAQAWMDLAEKDRRVLEALEAITGASVWGNVVGIHIAIFASALPGGEYLSQVTQPSTDSDPMRAEFFKQGKRMGLTDEEIEMAIVQAQAPPRAPARDTSSGGPGDTVNAGQEPLFRESPTATATAAPSGIVSPEQLGVTQVGEDHAFPADPAPPNGAGSIG